MSLVDSWKDADRSGSVRHPSGVVDLTELDEIDLDNAAGVGTNPFGTFGCCWCVPWWSGWTVCGAVCGTVCKW